MSFSERFIRAFRSFLPSPFTIAILLTVLTYLIAMAATDVPKNGIIASQTSFAPGSEITLHVADGQSFAWHPVTSSDSIITIAPDTAVTYWVKIKAERSEYSHYQSVRIEPQQGRMTVVQGPHEGVPTTESKYLQSLRFWEGGLWSNGLLVFALQMMLMLVLGHVLALTRPVNAFANGIASLCTNTATAAFLVSFLTISVSFLNWGLALIFGAILARKVGEYAKRRGVAINYAIVGAAGYSGLMTWHGGLSGSAPIKVAEPGHLKTLMKDILRPEELSQLPDAIGIDATVGSWMNIGVMITLVVVVPLGMYIMGHFSKPTGLTLPQSEPETNTAPKDLAGAERLDHWRIPAYSAAFIMLGFAAFKAFEVGSTAVITPNYINLCLLGFGLALHGTFARFLKGVDQAIGGASGILIQFPIYFGIMALMNQTGLVHVFSDFFVDHSGQTSFPVFTFISAGLVNIFVPSGGGQWGVQGPIIIKAAMELGIPYAKSVMALSYGDQVTNMLQPFWALPLLGITGLKAKDILPYTLFLFLLGTAIFISFLLIF